MTDVFYVLVDRIVLIEVILSKISENGPLTEMGLTSLRQIAEFLTDCFQKQCRAVLKLAAPEDSEEEVIRPDSVCLTRSARSVTSFEDKGIGCTL